MNLDFQFFFNSAVLGVGLAMDAFSISMADGLHESKMKLGKMGIIAGTYAFFQALMPLLGWACIHTIMQFFKVFEKLIPWISLFVLCYLGSRIIYNSVKCMKNGPEDSACSIRRLTFGTLILQAVATSIDALSVGFTIASYNFIEALIAAIVISAVTFVICFGGIEIGKRVGTKLAEKAELFGGCILILIGIEIFISSFI